MNESHPTTEPTDIPKGSPEAEAAFSKLMALVGEMKQIVESLPRIKDKDGKDDLPVFFMVTAGITLGDGARLGHGEAIRGDAKVCTMTKLMGTLPPMAQIEVFAATVATPKRPTPAASATTPA